MRRKDGTHRFVSPPVCLTEPCFQLLGHSHNATLHGSEAGVISVGSLKGWGKIWPRPAEHIGGAPEGFSSRSSRDGGCDPELKSWGQWQLCWSSRKRRGRAEGMRGNEGDCRCFLVTSRG